MMDKDELDMILAEGEGYKIEFKERARGFEKDMVAFANSSGGKIFLGVTDDSKVRGLDMTNRPKSQIQDMANNCNPKIKIITEEMEDILIIDVREGMDKPYACSSGFYKRIGPNSQKMERDEIIDIFKSEGKTRFDELIEPKFVYLDDFDDEKFKRFLELADLSDIDDVEKMLINLGVAEKQEGRLYFNNAGVLFFAKNPQRFVPWSVYTVVLFKDDAGTDIIDRKEIKGSLFEIIEGVMKFVKLYTKVAYRFKGVPQRENVYEYPFDAVREAVINSVMHKYYFEHGHNNILRFFPDRIKIENYWQEPANFVLGETVFRRNHIIADLFSRIHFVEKLGTGFERIREMCEKENAPFPDIKFNENYFYVTFHQSEEYLNLSEDGKTVEKTVEKIIELIKDNPQITQSEMAVETGLSVRGVEWNIKKLKKEGRIRRVGPPKGGHWEVLDDE